MVVTKGVTVSVSVQVSQHMPISAASTELLWTGGLPECAVSLLNQHCPGLPLLVFMGARREKPLTPAYLGHELNLSLSLQFHSGLTGLCAFSMFVSGYFATFNPLSYDVKGEIMGSLY